MGKMGRLREVALLLAVFLLLGSTGAYYDYEDYGDEDYDDDSDGILDEDYFGDDDYGNDDSDGDDDDGDHEDDSVSVEELGTPPTGSVRNVLIHPSCNNDKCSIRVDWEPPRRDTWMSCLLGYKVGFRRRYEEFTWIYDRSTATHTDMRSNQIFFLEEAEGTNHSVMIPNLQYQTEYEIQIEVFNPHGEITGFHEYYTTPQGLEFSMYL